MSLHEPCFNGNEWKYLKNCLDSNEVSTIGKYVNSFEGMLCDYTKSKYCISTVNGTSALHVAMILSNIGLDDQVLMPAFNFVATANAARYLGANPIFVDIEQKTLGIDPEKLKLFLKKNTYQHNKQCINKKNNKVIKALVLLHAFGHPSNISEMIKSEHKREMDKMELNNKYLIDKMEIQHNKEMHELNEKVERLLKNQSKNWW